MYPYNFNFPYNFNYSLPYISNTQNPLKITNFANQKGLFSKLATSFQGIRKINWSNLLNNTSKTLGVINQAIPIVRQTGPMISNMRSMLKVASAFKDETNYTTNNSSNTTNNVKSNNEPINKPIISEEKDTNINTSTLPNFFL